MRKKRGIGLDTCNERYVGKNVPREVGIKFIAMRILSKCAADRQTSGAHVRLFV